MVYLLSMSRFALVFDQLFLTTGVPSDFIQSRAKSMCRDNPAAQDRGENQECLTTRELSHPILCNNMLYIGDWHVLVLVGVTLSHPGTELSVQQYVSSSAGLFPSLLRAHCSESGLNRCNGSVLASRRSLFRRLVE